MYYVYVLIGRGGKYIYVGISKDVERRFNEHQKGCNSTTRPYRPFILVYKEKFSSRSEARIREKYLKSGVGKEWIKSNLAFAQVAELVDAHA